MQNACVGTCWRVVVTARSHCLAVQREHMATAESMEEALDPLDRWVYTNIIDDTTRKYMQVQHLAPLIAGIRGEIITVMRDVLRKQGKSSLRECCKYEVGGALQDWAPLPPYNNAHMWDEVEFGSLAWIEGAPCREFVDILDALPLLEK